MKRTDSDPSLPAKPRGGQRAPGSGAVHGEVRRVERPDHLGINVTDASDEFAAELIRSGPECTDALWREPGADACALTIEEAVRAAEALCI